MPAPDWEDLGVFFDNDEFACPVTLETLAGDIRTIRAIFDYPAEDASAGEYTFNTRLPRLTCQSTDVDGIQRGDFAHVDGTAYDVLDAPQYDGTGIAVLLLGER